MSHSRIEIKLLDSVILSGTLYRPLDCGKKLTVLKCDPYRGTDPDVGKMFQAMDYNFLYVHVRGTGKSGGIAEDEYSIDEKMDMLQVLAFIIDQPWSNGQIALYGISYSANNALHTLNTLHMPCTSYDLEYIPRLRRAIKFAFLMHPSYDNYANDVHWNGGVHTISDSLQYNFAMIASNMLPSHSADKNPLWIKKWLTRNPKYWYSSSRALDNLRRIKTPVLIYCGFHDLYCQSAFYLNKLLPNNVTIISNQGHEQPPIIGKLFNWFRHNIQSQHLIVYYNLNYLSITPLTRLEYVHKFDKNIVLHNKLNIGPFFRLTPSAKSIRHDPSSISWSIDVPVHHKVVICGESIIRVYILDPPSDFYIVGWILDGSSEKRLLGIGVQRGNSSNSILDIKISPMCIRGGKLDIYLTMSCVPMLVPQYWNSSIQIIAAKCVLPCASFSSVGYLGDILNKIPGKSDELKKYHIKEEFNIKKAKYTVSSIETTPEYSERFHLETTIEKTKFSFIEKYQLCKTSDEYVKVKCIFSHHKTRPIGKYKIYRQVFSSKYHTTFDPIVLSFNL